MKKSWTDSTHIAPDDIDWPAELHATLDATGMSYAELAEVLGLYVQHQVGKPKPCSPQFYRWLSGRNKPKKYLWYALRYIRLMDGKKPPQATKPARKPKD